MDSVALRYELQRMKVRPGTPVLAENERLPLRTLSSSALAVIVMLLSLSCAAQDLELQDGQSLTYTAGVPLVLDPVSIPHRSGEHPARSDGIDETEAIECSESLASEMGSTAAQVTRPVQHSERCPAGMLEVDGLYCTSVLHRCTKGGRTHTGEDSAEPEPFYCDAFQVGRALCLGREEEKHFCIDEYEYPNQKGTLPRVMVSWYEARRLCERQNKRLCGDDEWTLACEGPERLPYAYGWARDSSACNIDKRWIKPNDGILVDKDAPPEQIEGEIDRLSQRVPSGSLPGCSSPYGVMDMGGNVDEWVVNVTLHGKPYQSIFKGGHWMTGARNRCRPITAGHDETTAYYAEGFRCCADPLQAHAGLLPGLDDA